MEEEIKKVLKQISPTLETEGSGVEFVEFNQKTGVLYVRMLGSCVTCPLKHSSVQLGVSITLRDAFPEIKEVITI